MKEELLHYAWRTRQYNPLQLSTTDQQPVQVIHPGRYNLDAGPDFLEAKIKIGDTLWVGHVEIHVLASDWNKHFHADDPKYRNVILHVVYDADTDAAVTGRDPLPTLTLKDQLARDMMDRYDLLMENESWIPCQPFMDQVDEVIWTAWLERMVVERLERKTLEIHRMLEACHWDWDSVFYQLFAAHLGMQVNKEAFLELTRRTPYNTLLKYRDNLFQVEALLFGQAGMLTGDFVDDYPQRLQKEFNYQQKKLGLSPMPGHYWNFLRLRPSNFPTVRIAQLARIIHTTEHLFSKILAAESIREVNSLFGHAANQYWADHYQFDKPSVNQKRKRLGSQLIQNLIVNVLVPFLFLYGKVKGLTRYQDKAIDWLQALPPEQNAVISHWNSIRTNAENALQTQALLQLKKQHCDAKRCAHCGVGHHLLKQKQTEA